MDETTSTNFNLSSSQDTQDSNSSSPGPTQSSTGFLLNDAHGVSSFDKIPFKLSDDIQILIPISVSLIIQSLWNEFGIEENIGTPEDGKIHELRVWITFMDAISKQFGNHSMKRYQESNQDIEHYLMDLGFKHLISSLDGLDIHELTKGHEKQKSLIHQFYQIVYAHDPHYHVGNPSLLLKGVRESNFKLFGVFGGQGPSWFHELKELYFTYPMAQPWIENIAAILYEQSKHEDAASFYSPFGLQLMQWIHTEDTSIASFPDSRFFASAPISSPMITLTQLVHYMLTLKLWNVEPSEGKHLFQGFTGHSQGILAAVVVSISNTFDELYQNTIHVTKGMMWFGIRLQQEVPFSLSIRSDIMKESKQLGYGKPSPMLAILQLQPKNILKYIEMVNKSLKNEKERHVELALFNGPKASVAVGHPESLHSLLMLLHRFEMPNKEKKSQSRVPHSKRKKDFYARYLNVSIPFHWKPLESALPLIIEDFKRLGIPEWKGQDLDLPVYATNQTGENLKSCDNLLHEVIRLQSFEHVYWPSATKVIVANSQITHIVDFGHGGPQGIGATCSRNFEGYGVQVILAGSFQPLDSPLCLDKSELFNQKQLQPLPENWYLEYSPKLIQRQANEPPVLDTKFTRALGKPPIMVAGMTPTSVDHELVAAILNAGYHGELAGGGLPTQKMFMDRVDALVSSVKEGYGITLNLLFLNPSLWNMQYPLITKLAREGYPMEGLTCAAGTPSLEKATEIISNLKDAGLLHISFKPGTIEAILDVIEIARHNPDVTIILQWTGGRGGGHHSFEDFHEPILQTYAKIRSCSNLVLVGGSGFGDHTETWPYLNGTWSLTYGYAPMPFDAILIASRVMVCKEAKTSLKAKELLVETPGIEVEEQWETSYDGVAGGVITVNSELGEPIHKVATRGVTLWKQFDKEFFSLPEDKMVVKIEERKDWIISQLNENFQKVYFGKKLDGSVCDLQDMTYAEVLYRIVELMYIYDESSKGTQGRWIHPDFMTLCHDFARRIEERFASLLEKVPSKSNLPPKCKLSEKPLVWIETALKQYASASKQLLGSEDIDYFIEICRQRGRKPVNFVPVIDKNLSFWFKKDSLWQSEDLDAIQDKDVQRIAILQGPLAVRHSTVVNEPVANVLNRIHQGWIQALLQQDETIRIPTVENLVPFITSTSSSRSVIEHIQVVESKPYVTIHLPGKIELLPPVNTWIQYLSDIINDAWWKAFLHVPFVTSKQRRVKNTLKQLFNPRTHQVIRIHKDEEGHVLDVSVLESDLFPYFDKQEPLVTIRKESSSQISLTLNHVKPPSLTTPAKMIPLEFIYQYIPELGIACIHEVLDGRNQRIKNFYAQLWFDPKSFDKEALKASPMDVQLKHTFAIKKSDIEKFCLSVHRTMDISPVTIAPLDFSIVIGWESIIKSLFVDAVDGDLLKLVHLSNKFTRLSTEDMRDGDTIDVSLEIKELINQTNGQKVTVVATLTRQVDGMKMSEVESEFLFRGNEPFALSFKKYSQEKRLNLKKKDILEALKKKSWIQWNNSNPNIELNDQLVVSIQTTEIILENGLRNINTQGTIIKQSLHAHGSKKANGEVIASVIYEGSSVHGCIVNAFLNRNGTLLEPATYFHTGGYQFAASDKIRSPTENNTYAIASGDLNPIHTNPYFAIISQLPSTITHGMWTSANARRVVETLGAKGKQMNVLNFQTEFIGMVNPQDTLSTYLKHTGMREGRLIMEVVTKNQNGETVLKGITEIKPVQTSYVFTGQGSAEVGMGMDLYESSDIARKIWNDADTYFISNYGISILEIVRRNPKELTIFFGGLKGEKIRKNYMRLVQQVQVKEGDQLVTKEMPLFPHIHSHSSSFTFQHPDGLLFATQFSQPALVLVELSAFSDMKSRGLIPDNCIFAGHSLGEYAALASVASILTTESLVDIVFLRGMTMQNAVIRDEKGRSQYAMMAVNPGRVHSSKFRSAQLDLLIDEIIKQRDELLQVVNYNVDNYQYVVAGDRGNLFILGNVLNVLAKDLQKMNDMPSLIAASIKQLNKYIEENDPFIPLSRGQATIPLPGIDVPFHSRFLKDGVPPFRYILKDRMNPRKLNIDLLIGRYIPNVTAKPFSLEKSYVEDVFKATGSQILGDMLNNFEVECQDMQYTAFKLLVELLAYQFASPVRWIETQHLFFTTLNVEKLIEVGPAPTLLTMAQRTLATGQYSPLVSREILWYGRDRNRIYFQESDAEEEIEEESKPVTPTTPTPAPTPAPVVVQPVVVPNPVITPTASVPDAPVTALEFIKAIISLRIKKPIEEIKEQDTIKAIVGGKSALQNELLGDIETEFGQKIPEGASESSLATLAQQLGGSYQQLGKVGQGLVSKLVSQKMPGGFGLNPLKAHLTGQYGLGEGRIQSFLLFCVTKEPSTRFPSESECFAYIESMSQPYSSYAKVNMQKVSTGVQQSVAPTVIVAPSSAPVAPVSDRPISPLFALRVILSIKLKKRVEEISPSTTIKDLVGGKSALQNEIVGDLGKEFGQDVEGASEKDLSSLAAAFQASYNKLGSYTSSLITKLVSSKFPGGYGLSSAKGYLSSRYGFGEGLSEGVLLQALTLEPAQRLKDESETHQFLDQAASAYASMEGISLSSGGSTASGGSSSMSMAIDSALFNEFKAKYDTMIQDHMKVYYEYLGQDPLASERIREMYEAFREESEKTIAVWVQEHGDAYFEGIKPVFNSKKERRYDSSWNWVRQDCLELYYDYACGRATQWTLDVRERLYHIKNRATPKVVDMVEYYYKNKTVDDGHPEIQEFIQILSDTLRDVMDDPPKYREFSPPTKPKVIIESSGAINYVEVDRKCKDMIEYVQEMRQGPTFGPIYKSLIQNDMNGWLHQMIQHQGNLVSTLKPSTPEHIQALETLTAMEEQLKKLEEANRLPYLFVRKHGIQELDTTIIDSTLTDVYLNVLDNMAKEGLSLTGKNVLITGCGKGSIGLEILKGMLRAGAKVYATTSRFSAEGSGFYHTIFDRHGSKFSNLIVLPFNQGSVQDVNALVDYIYDYEKSDLDYIIPFAAISENGRDISDLDSRSELSHRIMLTNLIRLIGYVKKKKEQLRIVTRPAHVLLPLSPNHGIFGFDGLYAESKLGLEGLLNKWKSEGWRHYLSICGAIIGWTRGTGLMSQNNIVSEGIEALGARTFSSKEMCFNLMGLMHPELLKFAHSSPILADLNGCLHLVKDLNLIVKDLRAQLVEDSSIQKYLNLDELTDKEVESGKKLDEIKNMNPVIARSNLNIEFPTLPTKERLKSYQHLKDMLTLDHIIVVTGFGEFGPFGTSRTRWEMESYGEFSLEGCIELAWLMGFIQYRKDASTGKGAWFDVKTGTVINDYEIKQRYEEQILNHTGIRIIEPELFDGYDPNKKMVLHQVALNQNMAPIEVSKEEAQQMKHQHGEQVDVYEEKGTWYAQMKKNSVLYIPKALRFDRFVAGQVPTNWDPTVFGIPKDIVHQVDRCTLFTLVSTIETFIASGITDPYEFYEYVHVSEVGNTIGGGFGGMDSIRSTYRLRLLDEPVQGDILQETFVNTVAAWINMLLLSSSGPIKTPVGACATAVESLEIGIDTIKSGKAKICLVGGYDDFGEEGSYEFANMKATANSEEEMECGRTPKEMSRPSTSTRSGFVESQGAGTQILMSAELAIQMGLPIYAIVEHVSTATDKVGRSVPAPGQGILTTARESLKRTPSPLLDLSYRKRNLDFELDIIKKWEENEKQQLKKIHDPIAAEEHREFLEHEIKRRRSIAYSTWSHHFYIGNPDIAPLRGALAVYGLTVDDIAVASYHGTSTKGNDLNETEVIQKQLEHLGRSKGNVILTILQKYLTGHPKGAAASWMINGLIQSMLSGIVPGNRNADNIDPKLREFDRVVFLNRSLHTYGYKAGLLKSFGFGQVGGEVLVIHPDFVFTCVQDERMRRYSEKRMQRQQMAYRHWQDAVTNKVPFVQVKDHPPYTKEDESRIYLDPLARAVYDNRTKTWKFSGKSKSSLSMGQDVSQSEMRKEVPSSTTKKREESQSSGMRRNISATALTHMEVMMREMGEGLRTTVDRGIGVDAQLISEIEVCLSNTDFMTRNFTNEEINYCRSSPDPSSSFAGRWAAKEAVIKAISSCDSENTKGKKLWKDSSAPLKDIEILPSGSGAPKVVLTGYVKDVATLLGISVIKVAISHSGEYAIAQAIAR